MATTQARIEERGRGSRAFRAPTITPPTSAPPTMAPLAEGGDAALKVLGNLAVWDRSLRVIVGASLLWLAWISVAGPVSTGLGAVGALFLVTGLVGGCPVYTIFGLDSRNPRPR